METEESYPGIKKLSSYISRAVELFREFDDFYIFTHIDADGISAGAIIARTAIRLSRKFTLRTFLQLDPETIKKIPHGINAVFTDYGSAFVREISERVSAAIILDHHELPDDTREYPNIAHVNPHLVGIDGGTEVSASGLAFLFSISVNKNNMDLVHMALAGATGDMQDVGKHHSFIGINEEIARMGTKYGFVKKIMDFRLYGYETRPASMALAYSLPPNTPLSGNPQSTREFIIKQCGVDIGNEEHEKHFSSLTRDEKNRILEGLAALVAEGLPASILDDIYGYVYKFPKIHYPAMRNSIELAALLNACGKSGYPGIGIAILLGREELISEAKILASQFRYRLSVLLDRLIKQGMLAKRENFYYFHLGDEANEGIVSSLSSIAIRQLDKPLIGMVHSSEDMTKISARAPSKFEKNLGDLMRKCAASVGGSGGGHALAAGALIPRKKESEFLDMFERVLKGDKNESRDTS